MLNEWKGFDVGKVGKTVKEKTAQILTRKID